MGYVSSNFVFLIRAVWCMNFYLKKHSKSLEIFSEWSQPTLGKLNEDKNDNKIIIIYIFFPKVYVDHKVDWNIREIELSSQENTMSKNWKKMFPKHKKLHISKKLKGSGSQVIKPKTASYWKNEKGTKITEI
jgi:hypothetical protein